MRFWKILGRSDRHGQSRNSSSIGATEVAVSGPIGSLGPLILVTKALRRDEVERYGISVVAQPGLGSPCDVDVVCTHGLNGHPFDTWFSDPEGFFWPSRITEDMPNSRVMTFGYDCRLGFLIDRLKDFARNLLQALSRERRDQNARRRPIVFVAHNLGGFLVKETIILAKKEHTATHLSEIGTCTAGIIFLGTPHLGSSRETMLRNIGGILRVCRGPLTPNQPPLPQFALEDHFPQLLSDRRSQGSRVRIQAFVEEYPTPNVGTVVETDSATAAGQFLAESFYTHHMVSDMLRLDSTDTDHLQGLTKCSSPRDHKYKAIVGTLEKWLDEIKPVLQESPNDHVVPPSICLPTDGSSQLRPPSEPQRQATTANPATPYFRGCKSFTDFHARGQARVHAGDAYYGNVYYNYAPGSDDRRPAEEDSPGRNKRPVDDMASTYGDSPRPPKPLKPAASTGDINTELYQTLDDIADPDTRT